MSTATPSAADRVYAQVKRDILGGGLPGGSLVTEGGLAEVAGVSRTPVREALLRLEGEGLVRLYPKKGALVVPPSVDDARDVLEARVVIEEWAARAVWSRRADLFPPWRPSWRACGPPAPPGTSNAWSSTTAGSTRSS